MQSRMLNLVHKVAMAMYMGLLIIWLVTADTPDRSSLEVAVNDTESKNLQENLLKEADALAAEKLRKARLDQRLSEAESVFADFVSGETNPSEKYAVEVVNLLFEALAEGTDEERSYENGVDDQLMSFFNDTCSVICDGTCPGGPTLGVSSFLSVQEAAEMHRRKSERSDGSVESAECEAITKEDCDYKCSTGDSSNDGALTSTELQSLVEDCLEEDKCLKRKHKCLSSRLNATEAEFSRQVNASSDIAPLQGEVFSALADKLADTSVDETSAAVFKILRPRAKAICEGFFKCTKCDDYSESAN